MPRIRCRYLDCVFLDDGYCSAAAVEIDPNDGCATYTPSDDALADDFLEDEDELEEWEEETEEEDDDLWDEDDDEF